MKDYKSVISKMSLKEKASLLTGEDMHTRAYPKYDIKSFEMSDATSGVRAPWKEPIEGGDVAFPCESAMAATWDRDTVRKIGSSIGENCIEHNVDMLLSPAINLHRNPLCGRNYEYFSEDPYLTAEMAIQYVNGVQSVGVGTCLKHFAMNTQEIGRNHLNSECDERTMRELYLYAFERTLKEANPTSLMCAYNKINGIYCSENKYLLTEILRDQWKYEGSVVSDWGAVHNVGKALSAGLDLDMPQCDTYLQQLTEGLEKGYCTMEDVDRSVERNIRLADRITSFKRNNKPFDRKQLHKFAQEAAAESMVLLKNEDNILPINTEKIKKITVLGKFAEDPVAISGHQEMCGGVEVWKSSIDSPLQFIKEYADKYGIEITYEPLYEKMSGSIDMPLRDVMINSIKNADLCLFFIGNHPYYEMEGDDRQMLSFPYHLARLATDVCRFNANTIIIQQNGCAVSPYFFLNSPKAILQMWMAGEGGGKAVADILFGKTNPSGKLPMTFMKKINPEIDTVSDGRKIHYKEQLDMGYRYYDKHPEHIWYPFGYGLSYTTFEYSNLHISPEKSDNPKQVVKVSFDITNTGKVTGKEVAQVYISAKDSSVVRCIKDLKGFEKVELKPNETKTVEITLDENAFAYYNTNLHRWHTESGKYSILVGKSSRDIVLSGEYEIEYDKDYSLCREKWGYGNTEIIMA